MPVVRTSGKQQWWAMKEHQGRNEYGQKIYREVFRNMKTGEVHDPGLEVGWNGSPPNGDDGGCMAHLRHLGYSSGYDGINWDGGKVDVKPDVPQRVISDSNFKNNFDKISWNK